MINHLGTHLPYVQLNELKGKLIVIEGPDGSGRSTQILEIKQWLEVLGYSVYDTGIKRSSLVGEELHKILQGNTLSHRTMTLFYATDFADQLVTLFPLFVPEPLFYAIVTFIHSWRDI